jgi:hypothetical protein
MTSTTRHTTMMGELMSTHLLLLDRTIFRHTFHQKFNSNQIHAHISLTITLIYITIIEVHIPIYIYEEMLSKLLYK